MTIIAWITAAVSLLFIIASFTRTPKNYAELKIAGFVLLYFVCALLVSIEAITN